MIFDPIEFQKRYVPLTHSRVREIVDILESRLMLAASDLRPAEVEVKLVEGRIELTLRIGDSIRFIGDRT